MITPGPWVASDLMENDGCVRITWTDADGFEWQVAFARPCPGPNLESVEENASIIAAAPDLLGALQDLVADVEENEVGASKLLTRAKSAIAKATTTPK